MRFDKTMVIARREYKSRIQSKGFWLATLAIPILMGALIFVPSLLISKTQSTQKLALLDLTGQVAEAFVAQQEEDQTGQSLANFELEIVEPHSDVEAQALELDEKVRQQEIDAWVYIPEDVFESSRVEYHAESVSNVLTQSELDRNLSRVVRKARLTDAGFDAEVVGGLIRGIELATVRVSEEGAAEERGEGGFFLAYGLFFLLYMVLVLYGQQVMTGVLEEKSSRVVEVVISAIRPFELMLGKLLGIGGIGLTQLGIWLGTLAALTAPGVVATLTWLPDEVDIPALGLPVILHFMGHFLMGFFLFSALYAAIGAAFNNVQEAQQFSTVVVMFLIAPMMIFIVILNDPDSTLAVVTSLIPFFTPLLMLLRIAVKMPPWWQIALGYLLTTGTTIFMIAVCARIYRVGILMHGKKPTIQEIWRWLRYA